MTGSTNYDYAKAVAWRSGGSTQLESRSYNERLVVSLIRIRGELSKAELTELTGLAPQTVSSLVNAAFDAGLLIQLEPRRGGLGKPSVPYSLNPSGSYSFGVSLQSDGFSLVLVDFSGALIEELHVKLAMLSPLAVLADASLAVSEILNKRFDGKAERISGLGIASPFYGRQWDSRLGLSSEVSELWMAVDLRHELDRKFEFPVYLCSEGVAAAAADMLFGACVGRPSFISVHFGETISGGLVLENRLYFGSNQLAGRLGDVTIIQAGDEKRYISLNEYLDRKTLRSNMSPDEFEKWCLRAMDPVNSVLSTVIEFLDLDCIAIDGNLSETERRSFARMLRARLAHSVPDRPSPLTVLEGRFGGNALSIGAAGVPMMFRFSNNIDVLTKA